MTEAISGPLTGSDSGMQPPRRQLPWQQMVLHDRLQKGCVTYTVCILRKLERFQFVIVSAWNASRSFICFEIREKRTKGRKKRHRKPH